MLSNRAYNILRLLSRSNESLWPEEINYTISDFTDLLKEGLVTEHDKTHPAEPGEYPLTTSAFKITPKGLSALLEHEEEISKQSKNFEISMRSLKWSIVAGIASIVGIIVSILLTLLPILMKK